MLVIWRNICKHDVLATWYDALGLEVLVLFGSSEDDPRWGPNCADDAPVRSSRPVRQHRQQLGTTSSQDITNVTKSGFEPQADHAWARM